MAICYIYNKSECKGTYCIYACSILSTHKSARHACAKALARRVLCFVAERFLGLHGCLRGRVLLCLRWALIWCFFRRCFLGCFWSYSLGAFHGCFCAFSGVLHEYLYFFGIRPLACFCKSTFLGSLFVWYGCFLWVLAGFCTQVLLCMCSW